MEETLNLLKLLHDEAVACAGTLTFNLGNEQHRLIACLFATEIELAGAYYTLASHQNWAGTSPVLRAMLETHVHLRNIAESAVYARHMEAAHRTEWAKLLISARDFGNPYLEEIAGHPDLNELLAEHERRIAELGPKILGGFA